MPRTPLGRRFRGPGPAVFVPAAAALLLVLTACGGSADARNGGGEGGLSSVTLDVGDTGWARYQAVLRFANFDHTPYKAKWNVFAGGDLQLQALRAGALDVAQSREIPPVFAAADGKANFKVVAVQRANTLLQEVVAPKGSGVTTIAQLKGKRAGYVKNTTAHYFLYKLLQQAGLDWTDIKDGHEKEFATVTAPATHEPLDQALEQLRAGEKQRPTTIGPTGEAATASQQEVADTFDTLGVLPGQLDVAGFWTGDLAPALRKALAS